MKEELLIVLYLGLIANGLLEVRHEYRAGRTGAMVLNIVCVILWTVCVILHIVR